MFERIIWRRAAFKTLKGFLPLLQRRSLIMLAHQTHLLFTRDSSCLKGRLVIISLLAPTREVKRWLKTERTVYKVLLVIEKAGYVACFGNCRVLLTGDVLKTLDTWLSNFSRLLFPWSAEECTPGYRAHCGCICGNGRSFLSAKTKIHSGQQVKTET